ncbi:MAG: hypothetical protein ACK55Z_17100 [bacterium]
MTTVTTMQEARSTSSRRKNKQLMRSLALAEVCARSQTTNASHPIS